MTAVLAPKLSLYKNILFFTEPSSQKHCYLLFELKKYRVPHARECGCLSGALMAARPTNGSLNV